MVFREVLFRVDKVLEVFGDELLELDERNEGRLDMVGQVVRSGHPEKEECPSGVDGVRVPWRGQDEREPLVQESFLRRLGAGVREGPRTQRVEGGGGGKKPSNCKS